MDSEEFVELGDSLFMVRKVDEAIKAYDLAIEADAKHYEAWQHKAEALKTVGRTEEALSCYARALEINPTSAIAQAQRGDLLRQLGSIK